MNKAVPYVVAAALGIGVTVYLLRPAPATEPPEGAVAPAVADASPKKKVVADDPAGINPIPERAYDPANPPPAGTLRPLNAAELAQQERSGRPYNKHYDRVSGFWRAFSVDLAQKRQNPALARECSEMDLALRDRSKQASAELNVNTAIDAELALVEKLAPVYGNDPEYGPMLEYIRRTGAAVKRGEDPTTITRPTTTNPNPFD
jgi:hypothetical protein